MLFNKNKKVKECHSTMLETDAFERVGFYGQAKIQAEKLYSAYPHIGLTVSILRPKSFIGPERLGASELLYNRYCRRHCVYIKI